MVKDMEQDEPQLDEQLRFDLWSGQGRCYVGQRNQGWFTHPQIHSFHKLTLELTSSGGFSPSALTAIQHVSIAAKVVAVTSPAESPNPDPFASKPPTIPTLFRLATLGGAQVGDPEYKVRSLEVGEQSDATVANIRNTPDPHLLQYPHTIKLNIWGVGDDEELGLGTLEETARR